MTNTEAPQQYKQHSRKGKRAWRKHVDISEVQEGLENVREETIKGFVKAVVLDIFAQTAIQFLLTTNVRGVIAEKPAAELFTIDTTGSAQIQRAYRSTHKPLKADEIIARRSAVPVIDTHKRSLNTTDGILPPKRQRPNSGVSAKDYDRLWQRASSGNAAASKDIFKASNRPDHDPWAETSKPEDPQAYIQKARPVQAPKSMNQAPISLLATSTSAPALSRPKPSASYNPLYEDWTAALDAAGREELAAEVKRRDGAQKEAEKQDMIQRIQAEVPEEDMGYYITEEESAWEGFESEYASDKADTSWMKKRRLERKTPAERNRVKRRKEAEGKAKHDAKAIEKEKQAKRIHELTTELKARDQLQTQLSSHSPKPDTTNDNNDAADSPSSEESIDDTKLRRRNFGPASLPPKNLEIVLPDELQDSLRLLKPEGNLLKDRFRSMMVRGKIETRRAIQQGKKKRRSVTEKWTYKDFTIRA